jgi:hypothetical protein
MMAQAVPNPPPNEKKRVKVYELRNNDWFDRGTGFCAAEFIFVCDPHQLVASMVSRLVLLLGGDAIVGAWLTLAAIIESRCPSGGTPCSCHIRRTSGSPTSRDEDLQR